MFSKFFKPKKLIEQSLSDDQIRIALRDDLLKYACRFSEATGIQKLPQGDIPDLYVKFNGRQVAYLHGCSILKNSRVKIVHFAVEKEYVSMGFGEALAYGFADAVSKAYGIRTIEFEERSYSLQHEKLFKKLGAISVDHPLYPGKPNWFWTFN